jgi:hypothetical protein
MLEHWPCTGTIDAGDEMARLCFKTLSHIILGTQPSSCRWIARFEAKRLV